MLKKGLSVALLAAALLSSSLAFAAAPVKIPKNGCELAAMLGFVNIKECE